MIYILIPSFNEYGNIANIAASLSKNFEGIEYKIIFSDDGSTDGTWECIKKLSTSDDRISGIRLNKNCGKEYAIDAGLHECGKLYDMDCVIVMDCDMQHPPQTARKMYDMWREEKYDVISGVKTYENREHRRSSEIFNMIFSKISKIDLTNASDFKLLSANAVKAINSYCENMRFFRAIAEQIGMKKAKLEFTASKRMIGDTKWSKIKLIKYAVENMLSYSRFPASVVFVLAAILLITSFVVCEYYIITAGIVCILMVLALLGAYIGRIYDEVRCRPKYFIWERTGFEDKSE